jgi:hypothetical protein
MHDCPLLYVCSQERVHTHASMSRTEVCDTIPDAMHEHVLADKLWGSGCLGFPGLAMATPKARGSRGGSTLGDQLGSLRERIDDLERQMLDIYGDTSARVLTRMHELEDVTRTQCNEVLACFDQRKAKLQEVVAAAEEQCRRAEHLSGNLEQRLRRRADMERQETTAVLEELRQAISQVDVKTADTLARMLSVEQTVQSTLFDLQVVAEEARAHGESAEEAAARAQALVTTANALDNHLLANALLGRARMMRPDDAELPSIIALAQEVAGARVRASSRGSAQRTRSRSDAARRTFSCPPWVDASILGSTY